MSYMCKSTCPIYNVTQHKIHTPVNNNIVQYYSRPFGVVVLFRNMVSRRIFAPNMEEVTGHQRKLCNKDFHTVFSSQHIMRVIKRGRMRRSQMYLASEKLEIRNSFRKTEGVRNLTVDERAM